MTTKTLTGHYPGGYSLKAAYSGLTIASTASVGGAGVVVAGEAYVVNSGVVVATSGAGVYLHAGSLRNNAGGSIYGHNAGVELIAPDSVVNYGSIGGSAFGVSLEFGGTVINAGIVHGKDYGVYDRFDAVSVFNSGTITADYISGVLATQGGVVTNGGLTDTTALIHGAFAAVTMAGGTITNFATLTGDFGAALSDTDDFVTNGAASDHTALISGAWGGVEEGHSGYSNSTVTNFGTIKGGTAPTYAAYYAGVQLIGGVITNGSATDKTALIQGYSGVIGEAANSFDNFGTIKGIGTGAGAYGVLLTGGGVITNGSINNRSALIEGRVGVEIQGTPGTVHNFGTIMASGGYGDYGLSMSGVGVVTNGSAKDTAAVIEGYGGIELHGGAASNFGTILSLGAYGFGARVAAGTKLTNGSASDKTATIEGHLAVYVGGASATLTNFGTIRSGTGTVAVEMAAASEVLVVEAGSAFIGAVLGGGGILDLASGTGILTGLLAGGDVTVSGSMAATTFSDFATVEIGVGATFTANGSSILAAGQSVIDAGKLTIAGSLTSAGLMEATGVGNLTIMGGLDNTGTLEVSKGSLIANGAVIGNGTASIMGGTLDLASSFSENVTFTKSGELELAQSQGYAGSISGFSKTGGTSLDLVDIGFVSPGEASFSGVNKSGVLTVSDGSHTAHITLIGNFTASSFVASSDGHGGTLVVDPTVGEPSAAAFVAAMAGVGASGGHALQVGMPIACGTPMLVRPHAFMA